jgi:hypothetical protein
MNAISLSKRVFAGYTVGVVILLLAIQLYITDPFWWVGPFVGCIALGLIYCTAQTSKHLVERFVVAGCVSMMSAFGLFMIVSGEMGGRREYQSLIPFVIGFVMAISLGIWLVGRFFSGWKRLIARSVVFTLCLAPIPYGPEGTLMPLIVTLIFPPLIFLFLFPSHVALFFLFMLGFLSVVTGIQELLFPAAPDTTVEQKVGQDEVV